MDKSQRDAIKLQLKEQVQLYRMHTQSYIGRINRQETLDFFDRLHLHFMGPFESEEEFDRWCLERVKTQIAHRPVSVEATVAQDACSIPRICPDAW